MKKFFIILTVPVILICSILLLFFTNQNKIIQPNDEKERKTQIVTDTEIGEEINETEIQEEINETDLYQESYPVEMTDNLKARLLKNLPEYSKVINWVDNANILIRHKYGVCIYNTITENYQPILSEQPWGIWLSPDRKKFIYNNGKSVCLYDLEQHTDKKLDIPDYKDNGDLGGFLWSPDSTKLLVIYDFEWESYHYIYSLTDISLKKVRTDLPGYMLNRAIFWYQKDKILFGTRAVSMKSGKGGYSESGFRGDLAIKNLIKDTYSLITNADDRNYYNYIGQKSTNQFYAYRYKNVYENGEENYNGECILVDVKHRLATPVNFSNEYNSFQGDCYCPGKIFGIEENIVSIDKNKYCRVHLISNKDEKFIFGIHYTDEIPEFRWSPARNKIIFTVYSYGLDSSSGYQSFVCYF